MNERLISNIHRYIFACIVLLFSFSIFFLTSCSSPNITLIFHTNSENSIANISKTKAELESYKLSEPEKEGYTFEGWYFDNAYNHPYSYESLSKENTLIELYAKYKINEYTITVHSTDNIEYKFNYGEAIEVEPLEKAEHSFVGYYTDEALTKEFKLTTMPANNIDLYPKFDEVYYTLIFHTNSEDKISNISKTKAELETNTLAEPEKEGYTFEGWYFDNTYEHPYSYESLSKENTLIELYAKYKINEYTITVHSTDNIEYKFNYGEAIEVEPLEKAEHSFVGYYTDEALTKEFKLTTMPANNIDLYPKFDEVYYTLIFHTNSEDKISNISKTKAELETNTLAEPEKEGYTFEGWYFDNTYEHPYSYESLSKENTLIELYAVD